ncbi:glycosyl hydrolase family 61-domain-containing protein [Aspergillus varians]
MSRNLLAFASFLATVSAHGYVTGVVVNGVYYPGWDMNSYPYMDDPPVVAAWSMPNSNGPVDVSSGYTTTDIICNLNATNAPGYITVAAGDKINLQWTVWPDSHHGPVLDYLASCGDSCETVDKTALEFFKIDGVGLVDNSEVPGTWGDDELIENNSTWLVQIPEGIAPGNYVLRHEIIALHGAGTEGGAQNYPQCFNLEVTGSGSDQPAGTLGTKLYTLDEPGILENIYSSIATYTVPGPTLYSGASSIAQSTSAITSTGSATAGSGSGSATASASASASASATTTAETTTTTAEAATSTTTTTTTTAASAKSAEPASSTASSSTTLTPTTLQLQPSPSAPASSSTAPAASTAPSTGGAQALYQQCGGSLWKGATSCVEGSTCHQYNPYYSQCIAA